MIKSVQHFSRFISTRFETFVNGKKTQFYIMPQNIHRIIK